jgi:TonB family protein
MKAKRSLRFAAGWRTPRFSVIRRAEPSKESCARWSRSRRGLRDACFPTGSRTRLDLRYFLRRLGVMTVWFCALAVPSARCWQMHPVQQQPSDSSATLDTLAAKLSAAIADANESPVIVFDFAGPDELSDAAASSLADDFSAALARASSGFLVLDRARVAEGVQKKNLTAADLDNPRNALEVAKEMEAKAYVWGAVTIGQSSFQLLAEAFRVPDGKKVAGLQATLPLTDQMKAATALQNAKPVPSRLPRTGRAEYTLPACVYCPAVQYDQRAVWHHFEGTVTLSVLVTTDGRADDVVALKALPYGLTDKAIETVRSWRFKPAQSPDGSPVAVRQTVAMTFHLY